MGAPAHHQGPKEEAPLTSTRLTTRILAIDGRSGAGKSTLARTLAVAVGAQLVHVEDLYPGWDGLRTGAMTLANEVLAPLRAGQRVTPPRWDWHAGCWAAGREIVPGLIVVEGCGAISRASRPLVDVAVWLDAPELLRRERATTRDEDDAWWAGWAQQEEAFYRDENSPALADLRYATDTDLAMITAGIRDRGWPQPQIPA